MGQRRRSILHSSPLRSLAVRVPFGPTLITCVALSVYNPHLLWHVYVSNYSVRRTSQEVNGLKLLSCHRPATQDNPQDLTSRQLEILQLLAQGLHNPEIADRLSTTPQDG